MEAIDLHEHIAYVEFAPDGSETEREGSIWGAASSLGGMRCFWVLPDGPDGPIPLAVAVARASRRHRVGARDARGFWRKNRGRFVDIGDHYTELDPSSPTGALSLASRKPPVIPQRIVVPPLDPVTFAMLSGEEE